MRVDRRGFLKLLAGAGIFTPFTPNLFAKSDRKRVRTVMKGDLDDDLFVAKIAKGKSRLLCCKQMHNPGKKFYYGGREYESTPVYGTIDHDQSYRLNEDEILMVATANEREENGHPRRALRKRTHYKSAALYCGGRELFPSMIPENGDYSGYSYPLWLGKEPGSGCMVTQSDIAYNYFRLWENACVNVGLVLNKSFRGAKLLLFDEDKNVCAKGEVSGEGTVKLLDEMGEPFSPHPFVEFGDYVFAGRADAGADNMVRRRSAQKVVVFKGGDAIEIELPYPLPYPNRVFVGFV